MGREARASRAASEAKRAGRGAADGDEGKKDVRETKGEARTASASGAGRPRSRMTDELRRHAGALVLGALLVALSLVAVWLPSWGIPLGTLLGGGSRVTLAASAPDGSEASDADVASTATKLGQRARGLAEKGVGVSRDGSSVYVDVPTSYDADSIASSISGVGKVEFVRLDAIGDADALAKLEAGSTDVTLTEGTYTPFASSDNVTSASVVSGTNPYYGSTIWAVSLTLDADGTSALATATDDASSSSYVVMAVVVDGRVVATPTSSSKIDGGKMTVSGGFTESQARALAAELSSGTVPVSLAASAAEPFQAAFGGHALRAAGVAALVLAALVGLVASRALGRGGWALGASGLEAVALSLGVLSVLARFDYVILGTPEAVFVALAGVVSSAVAAWALVAYRGCRAEGFSVRKAQQDGAEGALGLAALVLAALVAVAVVLSLFGPDGWRGLVWAGASALFGALVSVPVAANPLLMVLTAHDADASADEPALEADDADNSDAADAPADNSDAADAGGTDADEADHADAPADNADAAAADDAKDAE